MEMAQGDMLLAGEMGTHHLGHRTGEPFSEATAGVALNCQQGRQRKNNEMAYCRDNAIIHGLRHSRTGGLGGAWDRWRLRTPWGRGVAHLIPNIATTFLVKVDDLHDSKRVLLLIGLGDSAVLEELLPFLGQAKKFPSGRVEINMSKMDEVMGCGDLRPFVRVEKVGHKPEHTFLSLGSNGTGTGARRSSTHGIAICRGRKKCHDRNGGCGGASGDNSVNGRWTRIDKINIIGLERMR